MSSRFSLYDFIAVIVPGIFFIWAVGLCGDLGLIEGALSVSDGLSETSILIVVGYVVGLLLHGIGREVVERILVLRWGGLPSALSLMPDDKRFSQTYKKELASALQRKFGIVLDVDSPTTVSREEAKKRNQEIFYRCYRSIEKLSDLPQAFTAQYGLFRSLVLTFGLLVGMCAWPLLRSYASGRGVDLNKTYVAAIFLLGLVVSDWQVRKRAEDFVKAVCDVFLVNFGSQQ